MEALSPFTRRLVALGLLFVVGVSAINLIALPLIGLAINAVTHLDDVRFERAQLKAVMARPEPPIVSLPDGAAIVAHDRRMAILAIQSAIQSAAGAQGARVVGNMSPVAEVGGSDQLVATDFSMDGSESAIVKFVKAIERGRPLIRLREWRLSKNETGHVQLAARAIAAWSQR